MADIGSTNYRKQVGIGFLGQVTSALVGFGASIVLARVLGPSAYGLFFVALAIAQIVDNPFSGWADACKKRMTEADFDERETVGSVLLALVVGWVLGVPLLFGGLFVFSQNEFIIYGTSVLFAVHIMVSSFSTLLEGVSKFSRKSWSHVIRELTTKPAQIVLVVAFGYGIWGMLGGYLIGVTVTAGVILFWLGILPTVPSVPNLKYTTDYAKWSVPKGIVATTLTRMDLILLGWLATSVSAGLYQVAWSLSVPAVFASGAIGTGMMGRISNIKSKEEDWKQDAIHALSYTSIIAIPLMFGAFVIGEELIQFVFGTEYSGGGPFLIGLAVYRVGSTQSSIRGEILDGLNRPDLNFKITTGMLVLNLVSGIGLLYAVGPIGIVIATVITQLLALGMRIVVLDRMRDIPTLPDPLKHQFISGLLMFVVILSLDYAFIDTAYWPHLITLLGVGVVTYFGILITLSQHLRKNLIGLLQNNPPR